LLDTGSSRPLQVCDRELMLPITAVVYFSGKVWKDATAVVS
jgi:hypothetical protein